MSVCAKLDDELLERRRIDLIVEWYDEERFAGGRIIESIDRRLGRAGRGQLVEAEVVRIAVHVDGTAERPQGFLANPEAARCVRVVRLRSDPRQHHRPYVFERDWCTVMDDEQVPSEPIRAERDPKLSRIEIVGVLNRLQNALERSSAQALRAALGSPPAGLEKRRLLFDQLSQPLDRRRRKLRRRDLRQAFYVRPLMGKAFGSLTSEPSVLSPAFGVFSHTIRIAAAIPKTLFR